MTSRNGQDDLSAIREADLQDLYSIPFLSRPQAEALYDFFRSPSGASAADWDDVDRIPGIGSVTTRRLIAYCSQQRRKHRLRRIEFWGVVISVLGLAVGAFTMLVEWQVIPPFRAAPTPSLPWCEVVIDQGRCLFLFETPEIYGDRTGLPCLPRGTKLAVIERIQSGLSLLYRIEQSFFDGGPIAVTEISPGSPAEEAGLLVGDVFVGVDDREATDRIALADYMAGQAGSTVVLHVDRDGRALDIPLIPRVAPPDGQGAAGFRFEGGTRTTGPGYLDATWVACPNTAVIQ